MDGSLLPCRRIEERVWPLLHLDAYGGRSTSSESDRARKIDAAKKRYAAAKAACETEQAFRLRDFFGANIGKARLRLAKLHQRVADARSDWQHKLSRQLADDNQVVAAGTLTIKGMLNNRRLSRAIAAVGWSGLQTKVDYRLKPRPLARQD